MSQIKEAIEDLEEAKTHLQHKFNDEMTKECIDQAIAKLSTEQPPAGEFTKEVRNYLNLICKRTSEDTSWEQLEKMIVEITKKLCKACTRLDRSEASRKELLTALEKYGDHLGCCFKNLTMGDCNCGLEAAITKAKKEVKI